MGLRKTFKSEIDDTAHLKLRIREAVRIQNVLSWPWNESRKRVFIGQSGEWGLTLNITDTQKLSQFLFHVVFPAIIVAE